MHTRALWVIQRQCFVKGRFCLGYMPKLQYNNSSSDDSINSGESDDPVAFKQLA